MYVLGDIPSWVFLARLTYTIGKTSVCVSLIFQTGLPPTLGLGRLHKALGSSHICFSRGNSQLQALGVY